MSEPMNPIISLDSPSKGPPTTARKRAAGENGFDAQDVSSDSELENYEAHMAVTGRTTTCPQPVERSGMPSNGSSSAMDLPREKF
jgi:hypothetical protein